MLLSKSTLTAAITVFALAAGSVAPAHAFGKGERNFIKGLAVAAIVGVIANDMMQKNRAAPQRQQAGVPQMQGQQSQYRQPEYRASRYQEPRYQEPQYQQPDYRQPHQQQPRYQQPQAQYQTPRHKTGRVIGSDPVTQSGVNQTASAQAFNSYSATERRAIQRRLANFGYYSGAVDGAFGPRTHQAIYEFARAANRTDALNSTSGAYAVLDALLT